MAQNPVAYGITTARLTIGATAVVGLSGGPGVFDMIIAGVTGGLVYMSGVTMAHATMTALGAILPAASLPLSIGGPVPCYFTSLAGSEVSVVKRLSAASDLPLGASIYAL